MSPKVEGGESRPLSVLTCIIPLGIKAGRSARVAALTATLPRLCARSGFGSACAAHLARKKTKRQAQVRCTEQPRPSCQLLVYTPQSTCKGVTKKEWLHLGRCLRLSHAPLTSTPPISPHPTLSAKHKLKAIPDCFTWEFSDDD